MSCSDSETILKIDEDEMIQSHILLVHCWLQVYVRLSPDAKILILLLFIQIVCGVKGAAPALCLLSRCPLRGCPGQYPERTATMRLL